MAKKMQLDFTNVKEGGNFNKLRQPPGEYLGKVIKVDDAKSKQGNAMWVFTIKAGGGTYPYHCVLNENNLWKVRNLFVAAGMNVPKKRVQVDPNKVVGKEIGVVLEDDEYDGKAQSTIAATIPVSELEDQDATGDDDEDEEDEEDDEESDDSDDEDDETEDEDDDEDEEDEEEPPPVTKRKPKSKAKATKVTDDELEELDVEEI